MQPEEDDHRFPQRIARVDGRVERGVVDGALRALHPLRFSGCNLTIPHKQEAMKIVDRVDETARLIGDAAVAVVADVSVAAQVKAYTDETVARWGRVDVAFNNAGVNIPGVFHEVPDEIVDRTLDVNVKGCIYGCRYAIPHMLRQGGGSLINTTSVNGLVANPGGSVYSASKFALEGWMEGLAEEIAPLGIRSLIVEPGMMRTNFLDPSTARQGDVDIADYAEAVAGFRAFIKQANGAQQNDPEALAALFNRRANAGDVEGLVALYEPDAVLAAIQNPSTDQTRAFAESFAAFIQFARKTIAASTTTKPSARPTKSPRSASAKAKRRRLRLRLRRRQRRSHDAGRGDLAGRSRADLQLGSVQTLRDRFGLRPSRRRRARREGGVRACHQEWREGHTAARTR